MQDIFFSKVQQRLLALLYGQPDRNFYTNEIIKLTKTGTGAVQRELARLTEAGFLLKEKIGNQIHYQANRANPLFFELRSIVLKTFGLSDVLKEALKSLSSEIELAFVYGSVAKHEDTANSDIDLMVISDKITYADLYLLLDKVEKEIGRPINPTCYSSADWLRKSKQNSNFINQIKQQPKIFIIGSEMNEKFG